MTVIRHIVDNRVMLLTLDDFYRERMKYHETKELLKIAKRVANELNIKPANVPIEGYYSETPQLTQYFRLMRALQTASDKLRPKAQKITGFSRLQEVMKSGLFGEPGDSEQLLPTGEDPFTEVMSETDAYTFTVESLTNAAYKATLANSSFSLRSLAALSRDAVVLAALGETIVLYVKRKAAPKKSARKPPPVKHEYIWDVDQELEERAQKFVLTFNKLFKDKIPKPCVDNVKKYWSGFPKAKKILGRCVCLAFYEEEKPKQWYHWAIHSHQGTAKLYVYDFWDTKIWTTERYRKECDYLS